MFVFVLLCIALCPFSFCNHLEEEARESWLLLQMYCYYKCSVTLSHSVVGWSAVCDCGTFPNHTHLLFYIISSVIYGD